MSEHHKRGLRLRHRHYHAAGSREDIMRLMEDRLYENEQGIYIPNGLSTELICFPSDLNPMHVDMLSEKIRNAISYAATLHDIVELNALQYLPPAYSQPLNPAMPLGLYLYFADEASRIGCTKTFLTAMREAHAELYNGANINSMDLRDKSRKALETLGFSDAAKQCLQNWWYNGSYTICGDCNYIDSGGIVHGAYANLAQSILQRKQTVAESLNLAISYAHANLSKVHGKTEQQMLDITRNITPVEIQSCIARGNKDRIRRIKDIIIEKVPRLETAPKRAEDLIRILDMVPSTALEMIYREGYSCVYANTVNLMHCYPATDVPGITHDENQSNRETATGLRQARYRIIFLCNGTGMNSPAVRANPGLRYEMVAQTLTHETMHMVMSYLTPAETEELKQAVDMVRVELEARQGWLPACFERKIDTIYPYIPPENIDDGSLFWRLREATNHHNLLYKKYLVLNINGSVKIDNRWQETACNVYGLMSTEFSKNKFVAGGNPFYEQVEGFSSLKHLAEIVEKDSYIALERCRAKHSLVQTQSQSQSQSQSY